MKRFIFAFLAFFALAGILNCTLMEPVLAYEDEAVHSEAGEESDCCFIHCAVCHLWFASQSAAFHHPLTLTEDFIFAYIPAPPDAPAVSIFHPPLAR